MAWYDSFGSGFPGFGFNKSSYTSKSAYAGSIEGFQSGVTPWDKIMGAIGGGLRGAQEDEDRTYQHNLDSWNKDFATMQFNEAKRQYDQNFAEAQRQYETNLDMQKNAITYGAQDAARAGISPLAMTQGATAPSATASTSSGTGGSQVSGQVTPNDIYQAEVRGAEREWQSEEAEKDRELKERELDIEEERAQNDYYLGIEQNRIQEENNLRVNDISLQEIRENIRKNLADEMQRAKEFEAEQEQRIVDNAFKKAGLNQEQQRIAQEKLNSNRQYKQQRENLKLEKKKLKNAKEQSEKDRSGRRIDNICNNITNVITSVIGIFGK